MINDEVVFLLVLLLDGFPREAAAHKEWLERRRRRVKAAAALHLRECNEKKEASSFVSLYM